MEKVSICAAINEKKKAEFFQTTESLQPLINNYCKDLKIIYRLKKQCIYLHHF